MILQNLEKVALIPSTGRELESFLGVACYLRDYVPRYSHLAAPLESIRKTKGSLGKVWNGSGTQAMEQFRQVLSSPPFLSSPDFGVKFNVGTDAS